MKWVLIVTLLTKPEPLEVVFENPVQCVQAMVAQTHGGTARPTRNRSKRSSAGCGHRYDSSSRSTSIP